MSDSDLTPLLTPHWTQDIGPRPGFGGTGQGAQYGQGTVLAWNPDTGENQIRYRGTTLTNVPLIGSTDILVIQPGDQVAVMSWAPRGGSAAYWIMGRLVVPGSDAATRSIQFLQTQLAKQISNEVIAERVHVAAFSNPFGEFTTSTSYDDLTTVGPTVSDVDISPAGKALVIMSASLIPDAGTGAAAMSFEVTGATDLPPDDGRVLAMERGAELVIVTTSAVISLTGLNPGLHTFQAKYKTEFGGSAGFGRQSMTVIAY